MLSGCAQPPPATPTPTTPTPTPAKPARELKLAYVAYRTGPAAAFGEPGHQGIDLLVEKINAAGGIAGAKIKVIHDDEGKPAEVVEKFKRLCLEDKVDVIMGLASTANSMAAAPVAEENSTLFLGCQARIPYLTWKDYEDPTKGRLDWVFKTNNSAVSHAVQAAYLCKEFFPDAKVIAQIHPDYAWGYDNYEVFTAAMKKLMPDAELLDPLYPKLFTQDYTPYITELVNAKPDYIFTSLWGTDATRFIDQLIPYGLLKGSGGNAALCAYWDFYVAIGRDLPVFGHPQQGIQGHWASVDEISPEYKDYIEEFKSRYGKFPQAGAIDCVTAFYTWKQAIEKAYEEKGEFPTNDDIRDAMENLGTVKTFFGDGMMRKEDHRVIWPVNSGLTAKHEWLPYIASPKIHLKPEKHEPPALTKGVDWIETW
jgi:branched-chain amino acid transport system substrate-binding protein